MVQKVISRDSLHYRKLTDKPKDDPNAKQNGNQAAEDLTTLGLGNMKCTILFYFAMELLSLKKQVKKNW